MSTNRLLLVPISSVLFCAAMLTITARADAQLVPDSLPPVLLIHGWHSDSTTWWLTAPSLQQVYGFKNVRSTNTLTVSGLDGQAGQLASYASTQSLSTASPILSGHSMGELLARRLSKNFPVDAIVTIGTPHQGQALIGNAQSAQFVLGVGGLLATAAYSIYDALTRCNEQRQDINGQTRYGPCYDVFDYALVLFSLSSAVYFVEQKFINGSNADMEPSGPWLNALNSDSSRAHELTSDKTSVLGQLQPSERAVSFYRLFGTELQAPNDASVVNAVGISFLLLSVDVLSDTDMGDPWRDEKLWAAGELTFVSSFILGWNELWIWLIGGWPNDGFIAVDQQHYEGANTISAFGLSHGDETASVDIQLAIRDAALRHVRH